MTKKNLLKLFFLRKNKKPDTEWQIETINKLGDFVKKLIFDSNVEKNFSFIISYDTPAVLKVFRTCGIKNGLIDVPDEYIVLVVKIEPKKLSVTLVDDENNKQTHYISRFEDLCVFVKNNLLNLFANLYLDPVRLSRLIEKF